jgi:anaerobic selenocysteine-containing dehydrogenase
VEFDLCAVEHAKTVVVWGMNWICTKMPDAHWLTEARLKGTRVVVIACEYSATASKADDVLVVRPGTTPALALGLANVIMRDRLYDAEYVKRFAATAAQTFVTLGFGSDLEARIPNVGASGAVAGVLGAYAVLLPGARILTLIVVVVREIPAVLLLGVWFLFQLLEGSASFEHPEEGGGIAFFAHVGGFVFGLVLVHAFAVRRPLRPSHR